MPLYPCCPVLSSLHKKCGGPADDRSRERLAEKRQKWEADAEAEAADRKSARAAGVSAPLPAAADPVALPPLLVLASSHCLAVVCTFCAEGFESIPTAFAALFEGGNTGKMLVQARL